MQGSVLHFYIHEHQSHRGRRVWEWLLEQAHAFGIRGGSAFQAAAGFGHHHTMHDARLAEVAAHSSTVEVEFIVTAEEGRQLLDMLRRERIRLFFAYVPARFGAINPDAAGPPSLAGAS